MTIHIYTRTAIPGPICEAADPAAVFSNRDLVLLAKDGERTGATCPECLDVADGVSA